MLVVFYSCVCTFFEVIFYFSQLISDVFFLYGKELCMRLGESVLFCFAFFHALLSFVYYKLLLLLYLILDKTMIQFAHKIDSIKMKIYAHTNQLVNRRNRSRAIYN